MYTVLFAINLGIDVRVTDSSVVRTCTVNFFFQLLFCLRYYRGDDKIRSFIWDLITPSENGEARLPRNHMGELFVYHKLHRYSHSAYIPTLRLVSLNYEVYFPFLVFIFN